MYIKETRTRRPKVRPCPREFLKSHGSSGCSRKDGTAPVKKKRGGKGLEGAEETVMVVVVVRACTCVVSVLRLEAGH